MVKRTFSTGAKQRVTLTPILPGDCRFPSDVISTVIDGHSYYVDEGNGVYDWDPKTSTLTALRSNPNWEREVLFILNDTGEEVTLNGVNL